ncbi:MAG: hypothetical protein ACP5EN_16315 [Rhodovulum sp.]
MGEYYNAFFSLAVGLERLCKLILSFDYQQSQQRFPTTKDLKSFGHEIEKLISKVDDIAAERNVCSKYKCDNEISKAIISELDSFADAKRGRYANFSMMEGVGGTSEEPLSSWDSNVGERILRRHFRDTEKERLARSRASVMQALLGDVAIVRHMAEDGSALDTIEKASFRTAENEIAQKYGRYYAFLVIRYLADVFYELTCKRGYEAGGEMWFSHYEHFNTFTVPDEFGLRRKIWPLR